MSPRLLRALLAVLPVVAVLLSCRPPSSGPSAPYDHPPLSESSVASTEIGGGEVGALADGLEDAGWSCARARANEVTVQVRCRQSPGPTAFDLVATPSGEVLYGKLDLVMSGAPSEALQDVLDAAVLRVWPHHRDDLADLVEDAQPPEPFTSFRDDGGRSYEEQYYDETESAGSMHYTLSVSWGEPLVLTMRGAGLTDRSWPSASDHYARTVSDSLAPLAAQGFRCSESGCWRPSDDQYLGFRTAGDQITEISFDLPDIPTADVAGHWVADRLPFLTTEVEPAVRAQILRSLGDGRSFAGVVAGTVLVVDTPRPHSQAGAPVPGSTVTIGVPLVFLG